MHCIIKTDGGARGNPGPAGIGVVVEQGHSGKVLEEHAEYLGKTTNNQAEYQAVLLGLRRCHALDAKEVDVYADSELLIKQAKGIYRVKEPGLKLRFAELKALEMKFQRVGYHHVRREYNKHADALANQAMDRGADSSR